MSLTAHVRENKAPWEIDAASYVEPASVVNCGIEERDGSRGRTGQRR